MKHPVAGDELGVRTEDVLPRGPAKQDGVEGAEQPRRGISCPADASRDAPARPPAPARPRSRQSGAGITQRQAGPPSQIAVLTGGVADEVTPRQLGQRHLAIDWLPPPDPVAGEDVGVLLANHRPPHGESRARAARKSRWIIAWPSVRTPADSSRSRSCSRVSGPSSASARSILATARSASSGETPSCPTPALQRSSGGVVSACSQG